MTQLHSNFTQNLYNTFTKAKIKVTYAYVTESDT